MKTTPKALRDLADYTGKTDDPDTTTALRWAADDIEQLTAERDKWIEYCTCDRADLVLALEAAMKENAHKTRLEIELSGYRSECERMAAELRKIDEAKL
jgi:hypothetical protein